MQGLKHRFFVNTMTRLALGPVFFVSAMASSALAAPSPAELRQAQAAHAKVSEAEGRLNKALAAKDAKALAAIASGLGPLIEAAMARQQNGQTVSPCELAAHSLAFVAISAAGGLAHQGEAKSLLISDARAAAGDFKTDMTACEGYIGRKPGSHTNAERALRAL